MSTDLYITQQMQPQHALWKSYLYIQAKGVLSELLGEHGRHRGGSERLKGMPKDVKSSPASLGQSHRALAERAGSTWAIERRKVLMSSGLCICSAGIHAMGLASQFLASPAASLITRSVHRRVRCKRP